MSTVLTDVATVLPTTAPARKLSICLINPRFEPSYWGFEYALPLYPGEKWSTMISGVLPRWRRSAATTTFTCWTRTSEITAPGKHPS